MCKHSEIINNPIKDFDDVWQINEENCPHAAYAPLKLYKGNPLNQKRSTVMVMHWDTDNQYIVKDIKERFAEEKKLIDREGSAINAACPIVSSNLDIEGKENKYIRLKS